MMGEDKETEQKLICPNCGEEVRDWQVRCRNCGELLDKSAGRDIPEPSGEGGDIFRRIGCFLAGLIPIPVWFFGCGFFVGMSDPNIGFWGLVFHPLIITPIVLYLIVLVWLIWVVNKFG
jgi:hypothetical protein